MDDTSRYGKVRRATRTEIPTHLASEDIQGGDGCMVQAPEYTPPFTVMVNIPSFESFIRRERPALPGCYCYGGKFAYIHSSYCRYSPEYHERERERAEQRFKRVAVWLWVLLIGATMLAYYVDHYTTLTTVEPAHAETVASQPPVIRAIVTAYTSSVDETDSTPNITASGVRTQPGVIACPAEYAFGTQVKMGDATYTCRDRMNPKYSGRFDVWVRTKTEARAWGKQKQDIAILP